MQDQDDIVTEIKLLEESVEVTAVLHEAVTARPDVVELVGVAVTDQVGRDAAGPPRHVGMTLRHRYDDVGLPCRKTNRSPFPGLVVGHPLAVDGQVTLG